MNFSNELLACDQKDEINSTKLCPGYFLKFLVGDGLGRSLAMNPFEKSKQFENNLKSVNDLELQDLKPRLLYHLEEPNRIFRYINRGFDHGYD